MPVAERTRSTAAGPSSRTLAIRSGALRGATHAFLRIGAGLLFFMHGAPKLFGWFGGMGPEGGTAELFSLMGLAGVLEVFGGLAIALGVLTRPVAVVLALEMIVAYVQAHMPRGGAPVENQGELALLYMLIWMFVAVNGPGGFSLDGLIAARRRRSAAG